MGLQRVSMLNSYILNPCVSSGFSSVQSLSPTFCNPMDYIACQAPLSMEFSRQEYWSGLPFPTPRDRSDAGIEPMSLASPAMEGGFFTTVLPGKPV